MDTEMARKRMIDPEFYSDEEVGSWSFAARLFYIGLWNFSDDEGRFKAHDSLLKSQIFPYDEKVSIKKLKAELGNKIQWYCDKNTGSTYGFVRNFLKYQKIDHPQPSKLPPPPEEKFDECSPNVQELSPPNLKEYNLKEYNIREGNFQPPSIEELKEYSLSINFQLDARQFIDFYSAKGWMIGKNKMKDWRAAVRTWKSRNGDSKTEQQKILEKL